MGRPSKFDRQEALEVVMNEIWKYGFEPCSVKAISEKLGITRSSFYNAFKSREALFLEVLDLYFSQSPDRVLTEIKPEDHVLPILTKLFKEVCRVRAADQDARGCMVVNCVAEMVGVDETIGPVLESAVVHTAQTLERLLQQAVCNGELKDANDIEEKALALQNLLIGLNVMAKVVRSEKKLWAATKHTLKGLGLYQH